MRIREWKAAGSGCGCTRRTEPAANEPVAVQAVGTAWTWRDRLGALRVRFGIRRMDYRVRPGLYAVGRPDATSPVLVSANYKHSFDHLRRPLAGRDAWILVIDTHGINVWCAAGKGQFGTEEVIRRVEATGLASVVAHRKLVLPQLAAPGVAAHEVRGRTGFRVVYGPVRAADLPAFLDARMTATPAMRRVEYTLRDRAVQVPVETVIASGYGLTVAAALLVAGLAAARFLPGSEAGAALRAGAVLTLGAFLTGTVLGPIALPWLPGRPFAVKGAALGLAAVLLLSAIGWPAAAFHASWLRTAAWALLMPAITSFVVMNLTGSSTFTSLSGVLREMRVAIPAQIAAAVLGTALWVFDLL